MGQETNQADSGHAGEATRAASCPRCGYDLEGARAAWKDSCPLSGVCSECGYEFDWADLLRADRQRVWWLYEHAKRWWRLDRAFLTCLATLWPLWFWRRVQPHVRINVRLLLLWPLVAAACIAAACSLLALAVWIYVRISQGASAPDGRLPIVAVRIWSRSLFADFGSDMTGPTPYTLVISQIVAFNVGAMIVCSVARSHWRARARAWHFVRVAIMGLSPAIALLAVAAMCWAWRLIGLLLYGPDVLYVWSTRRQRWSPPWLDFPFAAPAWIESWVMRRTNPTDEIFALVWLWLWWWAALHIGLRSERPFALWMAAALAGTMCALWLCIHQGLFAALLWGL